MYQRVYTISKKDFKKVDTRFSEEISSKSLPKFKAQKFHKRSVYATFGLGGEKGIRTPEVVLALTRFPIVRLRPAQPSLRATVTLYLKLYEKSRAIFKKVENIPKVTNLLHFHII